MLIKGELLQFLFRFVPLILDSWAPNPSGHSSRIDWTRGFNPRGDEKWLGTSRRRRRPEDLGLGKLLMVFCFSCTSAMVGLLERQPLVDTSKIGWVVAAGGSYLKGIYLSSRGRSFEKMKRFTNAIKNDNLSFIFDQSKLRTNRFSTRNR